mmetsp:Transcript_129172/g.414086  ORF Transcript_129172/g.414086 Transcript_129172/m.414086 type:complete len:292 (+) Transcript_129172:335-1210(+)
MALARSRLRCTASSMRRSCSTLREGSLPDKSTKVSISLASIALTRCSPACAVMPFFDNMSTRSDRFSCKASARLMMPRWSPPLAVRLLLSRFRERRLLFFLRASPMASAAFMPRLLPSHSSFSKVKLFSSIPANEIPSSSQSPLRFRSMDMQDTFSVSAFVSKRRRTEPSSIPQTVMWGALIFLVKASKIWSRPPSIFFRCSSSSLRFFSCSRRFCSWSCFCFCASCASLRRAASSCSFFFLRFSAASFFLLRSSILRFWSSSVRFVFGKTSTGGLKTSLPSSRMSHSSSS